MRGMTAFDISAASRVAFCPDHFRADFSFGIISRTEKASVM